MDLRLDLALSPGSDPVRHSKTRTSDERSFALQHQTQEESPFSNRIRDGEMKEKDGFMVGWPPVRSWRKQLCRHNRRAWASNYVNVENSGGGGDRRERNSVYVKVKMEGVGITRKIDLSALRSHRTLDSKLISLFGKCDNEEYRLMYENKEGEWIQARDATWECFINSVRRLKLERRMCVD